jgi:hypothetical protein
MGREGGEGFKGKQEGRGVKGIDEGRAMGTGAREGNENKTREYVYS